VSFSGQSDMAMKKITLMWEGLDSAELAFSRQKQGFQLKAILPQPQL